MEVVKAMESLLVIPHYGCVNRHSHFIFEDFNETRTIKPLFDRYEIYQKPS